MHVSVSATSIQETNKTRSVFVGRKMELTECPSFCLETSAAVSRRSCSMRLPYFGCPLILTKQRPRGTGCNILVGKILDLEPTSGALTRSLYPVNGHRTTILLKEILKADSSPKMMRLSAWRRARNKPHAPGRAIPSAQYGHRRREKKERLKVEPRNGMLPRSQASASHRFRAP